MKLTDLVPYELWLAAGLLSLALAHKSQIDSWAEANPRFAGALKLVRALGLDPWMLVQSLSLLVRGKLPVKLQAAKLVAAETAPEPPLAVVAEAARQKSMRPPPPPLPQRPMFPPPEKDHDA